MKYRKILKAGIGALLAIAATSVFCEMIYNAPVKEAQAAEIEPIKTHTVVYHRAGDENWDKVIPINEEAEETTPVWLEYEATAYCSCEKCCGKTDGITASGAPALENVTVAMDSSIPFFTHIYIEGMGERIVQDRGGAIQGNKIDIYFDSHEDALNFGKQQIKLYFMEEYQ